MSTNCVDSIGQKLGQAWKAKADLGFRIDKSGSSYPELIAEILGPSMDLKLGAKFVRDKKSGRINLKIELKLPAR